MSLAQCKVTVQVEKWHSQAPCWTLFLEWSVSLRLRRPNGSGQCGSHRCAASCPEGVAKATWGWTVAHRSARVLEVADQRGGIAKKTFFCRLAAKVWLEGQGSSWSHNLRSLCALRWMGNTPDATTRFVLFSEGMLGPGCERIQICCRTGHGLLETVLVTSWFDIWPASPKEFEGCLVGFDFQLHFSPGILLYVRVWNFWREKWACASCFARSRNNSDYKWYINDIYIYINDI